MASGSQNPNANRFQKLVDMGILDALPATVTTVPRSVAEYLELLKEPVPVINESDKDARARLERRRAGASTVADHDIEESIAARRRNEDMIIPWENWSFALANSKSKKVNAYTDYDQQGQGHAVTSMSETNMNNLEPHMIDLCRMIHGGDAYNTETVALGKLNEEEYLVLPANVGGCPEIPAEDVGSPNAFSKFTSPYLFGVYYLNKKVCPDRIHAIKFALVRMGAVQMGWFDNQKEIRYEALPIDYLTELRADSDEITRYVDKARQVAWLAPFVSEFAFRTKGHCYIDGQSKEYTDGCEVVFKACLGRELIGFLPPAIMYHTCLHWISIARIWKVLEAQRDGATIPQAIKIRMTASPSGCALIITSADVLAALKSSNRFQELQDTGLADLDLIVKVADKIRENPVKYHRVSAAYGEPLLDKATKSELKKAMAEATTLAPWAAGYCEANPALGRRQCLKKHAMNNPFIFNRARKYYQCLRKATCSDVEEALGTRKRARRSKGKGEAEHDDDTTF